MKKIGFYIENPFSLGGEQRVTTILSNYLSNNGYDIYLISYNSNEHDDSSFYNLDSKVKYVDISPKKSFISKCQFFIFKQLRRLNSYFAIFKKSLFLQKIISILPYERKKLPRLINELKLDYIIGISFENAAKFCILKDKLPNTKIICWQHSTFEVYFKKYHLRMYNFEKLVSFCFNAFHGYICQTDDDKLKINNNFGFNSVKIPNPNSLDKYNYHKKIYNRDAFISVGRFVKLKNYDKLINSFYEFSKINKSWKLYILGDGPEFNKVKKIVFDLNLQDRVIMPGKVKNVDSYYSVSSIYLSTSSWEGWGMSITEAMQNRLAVISFEIPSTLEIFGNKKCGILVPCFNFKKYSEAMLDLASDEDLLHSCMDCSIDRVKEFDIEKIGKIWINILR